MTPEASESKYVTYEWAFALGMGIKVIPLMLEQTTLHPRLDTLQYIAFDNHFKLDESWTKLLERLKQIEAEYQASPKTKISNDLPSYVQNAIDTLNHSQYFYTSEEGLIGNLRNAVNTLASSKHRAARIAFLGGLEHPNPAVRIKVAKILGSTRDKKAIPQLIAAIRDPDISVRNKAIEALTMIGDDQCVEGFIDALGDHDYHVRILAADALSNFGTSLIISALLETLQDKVGYVRAHAALSLGIIGDESAIPALSKSLSDKTPTVRGRAVEALERIGTPEALAAIEAQRRKQQNS